MRRIGSLRLIVFSALIVGVGVVLGLSIAPWLGPLPGGMRMGGMTMTGGSGSAMPGMTMPSPATGSVRASAAGLAAAHADVEAGQFARAIVTYQRVLEADPHNLEASTTLGRVEALDGVDEARVTAFIDRHL